MLYCTLFLGVTWMQVPLRLPGPICISRRYDEWLGISSFFYFAIFYSFQGLFNVFPLCLDLGSVLFPIHVLFYHLQK